MEKTSSSVFDRLAPFIQEYIYRKGWSELREVQVEAARTLFETDHHLLLASGTASGKTEAAFFPALTELYNDPPSSIGILYIGPLKALINDQFERLEELLEDAHIKVTHWHGDAPQSKKTALVRDPSGVLQITPESLESMLMNKTNAIVKMFHDLRYIIIDEVHAFMGRDRGNQLICDINRIEKMAGVQPVRIGLSATLKDYENAAEWLRGGSDRAVDVNDLDIKRSLRLAVEHFSIPDAKNEVQTEQEAQAKASYNGFIYDSVHNKKCIIFTNSRDAAEEVIRDMRTIAAKRGDRDIFYVHHGSISSALREEAEFALREGPGPAVSAATLTLELGIDIGGMDRIVQIGAPYSCSSFVQRLGRSGRRGNPSEMIFVGAETFDDTAPLPAKIPWTLLRAIAVIELYLKEKWIEPVYNKKMPMGLLYHQTMSILKSHTSLDRDELAYEVLSLPPFNEIELEDYETFLDHLIYTGHIETMDEGDLIIGETGERIIRNYHFYAMFEDEEEYSVFSGTEELGSITEIPPAGYAMTLAGRSWRILEVDHKHKTIQVEEIKGFSDTLWTGGFGDIDPRILKKMKEVLEGNEEYPYLRPNAALRLKKARRLAHESGMLKSPVIAAGGDTMFIIPWIGSKQFRTLDRALKYMLRGDLKLRHLIPTEPYYFSVAGEVSPDTLLDAIRFTAKGEYDPYLLLGKDEAPLNGKNDEFAPDELLRKAFIKDGIDLDFKDI